jgi:hypothetical protein
MVDNPRFPFRDPKAYLEIIKRKVMGADLSPKIGEISALAHMALFEHDELKILKEIKGKHVASPLEIKYWSGTPFWLGRANGDGGHAVKYSAVSRLAGRTPPPDHPDDLPDDYLTRALVSGLQSQEALFDFRVQLQTDPQAMPVEDASVEWDENVSQPITVDAGSASRWILRVTRTGASLSTHGTLAETPLVGMNRPNVYQAISQTCRPLSDLNPHHVGSTTGTETAKGLT